MLYGDTPLIRAETLRALLDEHAPQRRDAHLPHRHRRLTQAIMVACCATRANVSAASSRRDTPATKN